MRALLVIAALGLVGTFGCAAASSEPEEKGASESNLFGWGETKSDKYKTSGYQTSGSSSGSSSTSSSTPSKNYKTSGYKSSGSSSSSLSHGNGVDDPAPTGQGKFGDSCVFDTDCASRFCDTTVDQPFCSN